jgi:hypothetical protein
MPSFLGLRAEVPAFVLAPEETEQFDGAGVGAAEPMRNAGVEFGGMAGNEHQVLIAEQ